MGGAQAGEVASRIAADSFEAAERAGDSGEAFLRRLAESANERIHGLAQDDSSRSGMGTTLTAALVEGDEVAIAHVGDSRAYVLRDGELRLLTSDHSLVEELRRQGRLTSEQAEDHPQRSIITRALGPEAEVEVDTLTVSARPGDVFLLCSDGLTTMLKDEEIVAALSSGESLSDAATRLVREANEAGGRDNITVVAFRLEQAGELAADREATLIGPSAEEAGLTGERVRGAAERRAPSAERPQPPRSRRWRTAAKVLVAALLVAGLSAWPPITALARSTSSASTRAGGSASTAACHTSCRSTLSLYSEVYSVPIQASSVPEDRRSSLTDHELRSRDDALSLLDDLQAAAEPPLPQPPPGNRGAQQGGSGERSRGQSAGN